MAPPVNPLNTSSSSAKRADQRAVRKSNLSLVARRIAERKALSRAQLAKSTGLNKTTVSSLVAELSLFGGRGEVRNALFGALVIATVANGLNTLGYTSGVIFIVTGLILLFAVTLDTIARRLQVRAGR